MERRRFLLTLFSAVLALQALASPLHAKDGEGKGEGGDGEGKGGDKGEGEKGEGGKGEGEGSGKSGGEGSSDGHSESGGGHGSAGSGGKGSGTSAGKNGEDDGSEAETDHEEATEAVRRGEVLSYRDLLGRLREDNVGRVLRVELDRSTRGPVYRMRIEDSAGFVSNVVVDARTGKRLRPGEE